MKKTFFILFIFFIIPVLPYAYEYKLNPGVVITNKNYKKFLPELKNMLIPCNFNNVINGLKEDWITISIGKRVFISTNKGYLEACSRNEEKYSLGKNNQLIGPAWTGGAPFPHPENGSELAWSVYRRLSAGDESIQPSWFYLYNKNCVMERSFKMVNTRKVWNGRVHIPPIPEIPENNGVISAKEITLIVEPYDVRGFSVLRIRYEAVYKNDDMYSYIPVLRRVRRLTGDDTLDPLLGSDTVYDDFETWRQKLAPQKMVFKLLGEKDFLMPRYIPIDIPCLPEHKKPPMALKIKGNCYQAEWEVRTNWILEVKMLDPHYGYSKRILYINKEDGAFLLDGGEAYDQRGRLWRSNHFIVWPRDVVTGLGVWYGGIYENNLSGHTSLMKMYPELRCPFTPINNFTLKGLVRLGR